VDVAESLQTVRSSTRPVAPELSELPTQSTTIDCIESCFESSIGPGVGAWRFELRDNWQSVSDRGLSAAKRSPAKNTSGPSIVPSC
jgi:hypothetical protein